MASTTDGCCLNDPNFAVICSFINNFGDKLLLPEISFEDLQESLEDTKAASDLLVDLHVHLLRRIGKKVTTEKWQRSVVKFCHYFDNADAWEIEQNGYEKAKVSTKLKVLKNLLETQFDLNLKFKDKIGEIDPTVLRCQPLGRDINGGAYWYIIDKELNLRIYREEHPTLKEDEVWKVICRDRDDLASLVATLDAEINPNRGETIQDPKIEEECKEEEGIAKEEGTAKEEAIVKEEEKTNSSTIPQQNDVGHQSDKKPIETDKIADVESNSVADAEIKNKSAKSTVTSNSTEEEPESKSILKDGCVKVEPEENILKAPLRQGENTEATTASDGAPKNILEDEKRNELKKDKTNTDSVSESKAEKRKLTFSEPTEIGSKSRKECSDHVSSSSQKTSDSNDKSEKIPETVSKETAAANLRRESVIKIGKRVDKVIPLEESAKQSPSENKEELSPNKSVEKETLKTDIVIISDTDKDIEAIVKNEEVKKRMNELNKSPDCYKLNERLNEEMNRNIQFTDDENFDDKIVLMKEYTKDYEQLNMCKEKVSSAFRSPPAAVGSEEKVQNLREEKVMSVAKTSDSDKTCTESESKSCIKEDKVNKLQSVGDSTENILPKKCNIEKPEKGSDLVRSENKEPEEKLKVLNSYKKENQLQNKDSDLQKASEDTPKGVNIEKKSDPKIHNSEKESSLDEKQVKLGQKPTSCKQDSTVEEKSQSSNKDLDSQKKPNSGEKESGTQSKEEHTTVKISHDSKEELISASKPQAKEKGSVIGNISSSGKEHSGASNTSSDKKGEVVVKSISQGSKEKLVDASSEGKSQAEIKSSDTKETKSKSSVRVEKVDAGDKKGIVASGKLDSSVEKTSSESKLCSEKDGAGKEKSTTQEKLSNKKKTVTESEPSSQGKKLNTKSGDSKKEESGDSKKEAITKIRPSDEEKSGGDIKCSDKKDKVTAKSDSEEKSGGDSKEKVTAKSKASDIKDKAGDSKSSDSKEKATAKSKPSDIEEKASDSKSSDSKEKATAKSKPSESEDKSGDSKSSESNEIVTAKSKVSDIKDKGGDSKEKATAKSKPSDIEDKAGDSKSSDSKEKATAKSKSSESEDKSADSKSSDSKEKATAKSKSSESEDKSADSKSSDSEEIATAKSKSSESKDKSADSKSSDSKEKATTKSKPSESEDKSGDSKSSESKEKETAQSKPSESEDKSVDNKSSDRKEKATAKSKASDIKDKSVDSKSSESKEKETAQSKPSDIEDKAGDSKSSDSKEKAAAKSKPSESEAKSADTKSSDSKEKATAKCRPESEDKSRSAKGKSAVTSSFSSDEKSEDKSKSCNNEEEMEEVSTNRPHDIEDLSPSKGSLNSKKEPGGKSRPLGSEVEPGGKSCSLVNKVKVGNKSEPLGREIEQTAENQQDRKEEEATDSRDKPLKKDEIATDEPKPEGCPSKESSKSATASDEKNSKSTDDEQHSEDLPKLKISLNKIQTTANEEMSTGNEEKKLTCKIVIKRKSRRKDCVGGKNVDGTDELDDHEDDDEDKNDDDSGKMAKNQEDNIEYKCELSSVSVDKPEESGKKDSVQRLRKRKACDKMPITPSKNDRKTTGDLGNEECVEQIQNDDKVTDQNLKPEGESDTEESNVRASRRLRSRRTNKSSGLETEQTKTEPPKEAKPEAPVNTENEAQPTKKTRSKRRTQDELLCMDFIIPEEEKRSRGRKRQNTSVEALNVEEEIEAKKVKGSKNFRKTKVSRLKDNEEQCSSPSDSDDMPLSKMTRTTARGRARGRGPRKGQRQPLTVIEESVATPTRKSRRTTSKKKEVDPDVNIPPATGKSIRGGSSAAGKGSRSRQRKKRGSSVESDKWVSDKTEGEEEEEEDDEEEEDLFVGELLRRSSRVRSLGTKNKLLCVSASSDEKSETNEDTSDEEFQLPKGRNARRAAARFAATEETEKIDENDNEPCRNCQKFDRPETILLCDKCDAGYHTLCLTPPLHIIPEGDWFCPPCEHKMLLEKLMTNLHELDIQLKKRERLMKRKERLAFVGISLDNILSEKKENMEPNVDCPAQPLSTQRTCRARRSINYKFTEFDELIDSAIQDDLSTVHHDPEGTTEDSSQNGKDINNSGEEPVSLGKNMDTIMTAYSDDLRPQGIQAKKEAGRRRGKDISNLVGRGSDSDEQYPAPRKRRPKRKLTTLDSDSYASDSDEYKASEDSDASADMDASEYSEEEEDDDDDDEDYGTRRRSTRRSTYRASRKSGRAATRRSRRQRFDDFVVDDDYDSDESANYRRSTRASVKRKVNYREKASDEDEEEEAEMTPTESEESSTELSDLGSDDSVKPNKKLKLKLKKKKTKRVIRESPSDDDDDDDKSSKSSESVDDDKNKKKLTRKRRLASDSGSSSSSESESGVRRSCRASTQKMNYKNLLDSDTEEEFVKIERPYTVTRPKLKVIMSDSDSIASDDKSSIKSFTLDKNENDSKFSHSSTTTTTTAAGAGTDDADTIATATPPPTITTDTTPSTITPSTTTTTAPTPASINNNNSHEAHLKADQQQNEGKTVDSSFSQMNGHDNEKTDTKDTHLEKTENRTIATELHQEDNCNNDNDDTSNLGTSTSRSGPQVHP